MSGSYRELRVWQQALELSKQVYRVTDALPRREWFCLAQQMRRAAVSVPSNIAEGKARRTDRDFSGFLYVARGSRLELETQILLAHELAYMDGHSRDALLKKCAVVGSALTGLINPLRDPQGLASSV